jgi:prepilin-type processing-associated H-X9-DG protein
MDGAKVVAGKIKPVKIDTREARGKLATRGQPYYVELLNGLHLGYRKGARRGVWVSRRWVGDGYVVTTLDGVADDTEPADGELVLSFDQARRATLKMADDAAKAAKGHAQRRRTKTAPYSVADAIEVYLNFLDRERRSGRISRNYAVTSILPKLAHIALRDLTRDILNDWLHDLAASPRKTKASVASAPPPTTDEEKRRRRSSANRVYAVLRGALNYAFADGHVDSDSAWRRVKPLREADAARVRRFTTEEMRALAEAAEEPFRSLLIAALHTGARYGELCRLSWRFRTAFRQPVDPREQIRQIAAHRADQGGE